MENVEILLNEKKPVQIKDRTYEVGALGYKQIKNLFKWIVKMQKSLQNHNWSDSNMGDIMLILAEIPDENAAELFAIVLKENDFKFIIDNVLDSVLIMNRILEIVVDKNDVTKLYENFLVATGQLNKEAEKKTTP